MALIATSNLVLLCRRAAIAVRSGIDARRTWEMEAAKGGPVQRRVMEEIRRRVAVGDSLADAFADSQFFPALVVEMVRVGEQTGKLDEVFSRLADHYENLLRLQRSFLQGIAWPLIQLGMAIFILAGVIWLPSAISPGNNVDILGLGLVGTRGVVILFLIVAIVIGAVAGGMYGLVKGWFGDGPVLAAMRFPLLGRCFECLSIARLAWAMAMAHESGMSARRTAKLALAATQHPLYSKYGEEIDRTLAGGRPFYEAFASTGVFPVDFLDVVQTAEITGTITETLLRKSHDCEEEARRLLTQLTWISGAAVYGMVVVFMVIFIFRLAFFYLGILNGVLQDPMGGP